MASDPRHDPQKNDDTSWSTGRYFCISFFFALLCEQFFWGCSWFLSIEGHERHGSQTQFNSFNRGIVLVYYRHRSELGNI